MVSPKRHHRENRDDGARASRHVACRWVLAVLVGCLVTAIGATAVAQSPLDFRQGAPPIVIVAVDSSGSMEWKDQDRDPACCGKLPNSMVPPEGTTQYPDDKCTDPRYDNISNVDQAVAAKELGLVFDKSRQALATEVLTGRYVDFWCREEVRAPSDMFHPGAIFDIDDSYPLIHTVPDSRSRIRDTGLIRLNRDLVRFGFVSFDSNPVPDAPWSFIANDLNEAVWNLGIRGPGAPNAPSIDVGDLANVAIGRSVASEVEAAIDEMIPFGATPLGPMFRDLGTYLTSPNITNDPFAACRNKEIILITDGTPTYDDCAAGEDRAGTTGCRDPDEDGSEDGDYPYATALEELAILMTKESNLRVHVIGFNLPFDNRPCREGGLGPAEVTSGIPCIHQLAEVGDTDADEIANNIFAHIAQNQLQLTAALSRVMNNIVSSGAVSARTAVAVTNRTSTDTDTTIRQYQFSGAFGVDSEFELWRGVLERREFNPCAEGLPSPVFLCDASDPPTTNCVFRVTQYQDTLSEAIQGAVNDRKLYTAILDTNSGNVISNAYYESPTGDQDRPPIDSTTDPDLPNRLINVNVPSLYEDMGLLNNAVIDEAFGANSFQSVDWNAIQELINGDHPNRNKSDSDFDRRRVLGDIFHASPVVVGAPDLELDIAAYEAFQTEVGDRPTTLLVGANDGMVHLFNAEDPTDGVGGELWAYIPQEMQPKLYLQEAAHIYGVDATPLVRDLRIYRGPAGDAATFGYFDPVRTIPGAGNADIWATVAVGGFRTGGRGYYALEMSKPHNPHFLWELNSVTEGYKIDHGSSPDPFLGLAADSMPAEALLGLSYGQVALGTVRADLYDDGTVREHAIAIIPGGFPFDPSSPGEVGKAIYVVDVMSGQIIRRFREFIDTSPIDHPVTSSVAAWNDFPGSLITRAYVGDAIGRLLRIDLRNTDPDNWYVENFFDDSGNPPGSPVVFKPALAPGQDGDIVIVYGTGEVDRLESRATAPNKVFSVTERVAISDTGGVNSSAFSDDLNWRLTFDDLATLSGQPAALVHGEKLTGSPLIFNNQVFFPSYVPNNGDGSPGSADACDTGNARIWALDYVNNDGDVDSPIGVADSDGEIGSDSTNLDLDADDRFFELGPNSVVFGLQLAQTPACVDPENFDFGTGANEISKADVADTRLELIAQTGTSATTTQSEFDEGSGPSSSLNSLRLKLPPVNTTIFPSSWSVVMD